MSTTPRGEILEAPVGRTLLRLALPMVVGIASIIGFQITDTYFVGQLGVAPLAAMSFTFPVTLLVLSVSMGLSAGTTAVIAQAIGQGDRAGVRRLTTDALLLSVVCVTAVSLLGMALLDPVFRWLGADDDNLSLIRSYMVPWFLAVGFLVIPMVGNGAIRATGDTRTPMAIMMVAALLNVALDPIFIFGWGPVPRLELQGAAIATGISWFSTLLASLWVLSRRERMLELRLPRVTEVLASWKRVVHLGAPATLTSVAVPLATAILTRFVARYGDDAVAAYGVGTRIEGLAMIGANALSTAMTPFAGQNYGAGRIARVETALRFAAMAAIVWGGSTALLLGLGAGPISRAFAEAPSVQALSVSYLRLVPLSYAPLGVAMVVTVLLNALNQPSRSTLVVIVRLFVLAIPFAYLGSWLGEAVGLFLGLSVSNVIIGVLAYLFAARTIAVIREEKTPTARLDRPAVPAPESR